MHWLTMQLATEVKIPHLFSAFRQLLDAEGAPGIVESVDAFARDAQVFAAFGSWPPNSVEATFFARMRTLDTTTHFPLALLLFKQSADVLSCERRRRALLILAAEQQMRGRFSESVSLSPGLTVEHVLPRTWRDHWPVPDDAELRRDRELHIDRLGNLTLVTGRLNSSASNGPWEAKRNGLNAHSALFINRPLVDHHGMWDEGSIDSRSKDLADHILRAWPGPNEAEWPSVE